MSKSNSFETGLLKLIFQNVSLAGIGDVTGILGSTASGGLYISLHTADPGEGGNQTTNEATYIGYDRPIIGRGTGSWSVSGNQASNLALVAFSTCTSGLNTIDYIGVGTDAYPSSGILLYSTALATSLIVSANITPTISPGDFIVSED